MKRSIKAVCIGVPAFVFFIGWCTFIIAITCPEKECPDEWVSLEDFQAEIESGELRFFLEDDSIVLKAPTGFYYSGSYVEIWYSLEHFDSISKARAYSKRLALECIENDEVNKKNKLAQDIENRMWERFSR